MPSQTNCARARACGVPDGSRLGVVVGFVGDSSRSAALLDSLVYLAPAGCWVFVTLPEGADQPLPAHVTAPGVQAVLLIAEEPGVQPAPSGLRIVAGSPAAEALVEMVARIVGSAAPFLADPAPNTFLAHLLGRLPPALPGIGIVVSSAATCETSLPRAAVFVSACLSILMR